MKSLNDAFRNTFNYDCNLRAWQEMVTHTSTGCSLAFLNIPPSQSCVPNLWICWSNFLIFKENNIKNFQNPPNLILYRLAKSHQTVQKPRWSSLLSWSLVGRSTESVHVCSRFSFQCVPCKFTRKERLNSSSFSHSNPEMSKTIFQSGYSTSFNDPLHTTYQLIMNTIPDLSGNAMKIGR